MQCLTQRSLCRHRASPLTRSLRVALADTSAVTATAAGHGLCEVPDPRCSTLTPASARCLQAAGVWADVERSGRCSSFHSMQVWDALGSAADTGVVRYTAQEAGRASLGHVVENAVLSAALHTRLSHDATQQSGGEGALTLLTPDTVQQLCLPSAQQVPPAAQTPDAGPDWAAVHMQQAGWVRARLVVAADGGQSHTRRLAGLRTVGWRYPQTAVVGVVTSTPGDHGTAWQRFLPDGPLAVLPMHGGYSSVVWTTSPGHAAHLTGLSAAEFAGEVHAALHGQGQYAIEDRSPTPHAVAAALAAWRLLNGTAAGPAADMHSWQEPPAIGAAPESAMRGSFPLALRHAPSYVLPRLALVGDAAHAVHPLAGQGLNLGISDARLLANALEEAVRGGSDIGDSYVLQGYARTATHTNAPMVAAVDVLQRLFSSSSGTVAALRSAGLSAVNTSPALRRAIIAYATGEQSAALELDQQVVTV